jgi:endonuclease YncB( thermonuclease family)
MEACLRGLLHLRPLVAAILLIGADVGAGVAQESCIADAEPVSVVAVSDLRSLVLADGRVLHLAGIETFALLADGEEESASAEAALAERLAAFVSDDSLSAALISETPDRYGRLSALVVSDSAIAQETLAREGLAIAYASGDALPCFERILAAEAAAREARRGFWTAARLPEAWPAALASRIGRFAIFEGVVASVGNRRARTYLNFGRHWLSDVTAIVEAAARESFGGEAALENLAGRRVRIRGYLEERDGPLVTLTSPMQMQIVDGDGVSP